MQKPLTFRFEIPRYPHGSLIELSAVEMEKVLLKNLADPAVDKIQSLWELADFYKQSRQQEKALERLRQLQQLVPDPEEKAQCVLGMGQTMEYVADFPAAVRYYKEALALEPTDSWTWYFINNNLGFSLNTLGHFAEGEIYCRKAIGVDSDRCNAHKNLGIALSGQGRYREAANAFVTATQVNAADQRAFHLLASLLKEHPELEYEFGQTAGTCQKAIEFAAERAAEHIPIIHRGWRKQFILLRVRIASMLHSISRLFRKRAQAYVNSPSN